MDNYYGKYIKYKNKYINLKMQYGGGCPKNLILDEKTPFVSSKGSINTLPIILGPYFITPKIQPNIAPALPFILTAFNRINQRLKLQTQLRNERRERLDQLKQIKKPEKESYGIGCKRAQFETKLDEKINLENNIITEETAKIAAINIEMNLLKNEENKLIEKALIIFDNEFLKDNNKEKQIMNYKNYMNSINIVFIENEYYLQHKINIMNNKQLKIIELKLKEFKQEPNPNTTLQKYKDYQLLFTGIYKEYLQYKINNLMKIINNINHIIKYYIETVSSINEQKLKQPKRKQPISPSQEKIISLPNIFKKHDNDIAKDLTKLLALSNVKSKTRHTDFTNIKKLGQLLNIKVINTFEPDILQTMLTNANNMKTLMETV